MKLLEVLLLLIFVSASQFSSASEAGGPPKVDDLIGFWKMKEWPNPDANKVNLRPLPYQWFAFYRDGRLLSIMKSEDSDYTAKGLSEIFSKLPFESPKYKLQGQFLVVQDPNIKGHQEIWGVNLFAKDVGTVAKKGDLVMSLAGEDGAPVYFRLLEKLK